LEEPAQETRFQGASARELPDDVQSACRFDIGRPPASAGLAEESRRSSPGVFRAG
jgi:hypothetical protein